MGTIDVCCFHIWQFIHYVNSASWNVIIATYRIVSEVSGRSTLKNKKQVSDTCITLNCASVCVYKLCFQAVAKRLWFKVPG